MSGTRWLPVLMAVGLMGCAGAARNADCRFPFEDASPSTTSPGAVDRRALDREALLAEDLAIRFADRTAGPRSKWPQGRDGYRTTREQCMATLFDIVGRRHGVSRDQVRAAATHRGWSFDALTLSGFAVLYGIVAIRVVRRITGGGLATSAVALLIALVVASLALAVVAFGAGSVWFGITETIRLGNGHASYRAERILWRQHPLLVFIASLALFWLIVTYHFWSDGIEAGVIVTRSRPPRGPHGAS